MDSVRRYIISVSAAAVLCSIAKALLPKGNAKVLVTILCGSFLTYTIIFPFRDIKLDTFLDPVISKDIFESDEVREGREIRYDTISKMIIDNTETIVENKALEYGVIVTAEVTVSEDDIPIPISITVYGSVSPFIQKQLQEFIRNDLGITEEKQLWTG